MDCSLVTSSVTWRPAQDVGQGAHVVLLQAQHQPARVGVVAVVHQEVLAAERWEITPSCSPEPVVKSCRTPTPGRGVFDTSPMSPSFIRSHCRKRYAFVS